MCSNYFILSLIQWAVVSLRNYSRPIEFHQGNDDYSYKFLTTKETQLCIPFCIKDLQKLDMDLAVNTPWENSAGMLFRVFMYNQVKIPKFEERLTIILLMLVSEFLLSRNRLSFVKEIWQVSCGLHCSIWSSCSCCNLVSHHHLLLLAPLPPKIQWSGYHVTHIQEHKKSLQSTDMTLGSPTFWNHVMWPWMSYMLI